MSWSTSGECPPSSRPRRLFAMAPGCGRSSSGCPGTSCPSGWGHPRRARGVRRGRFCRVPRPPPVLLPRWPHPELRSGRRSSPSFARRSWSYSRDPASPPTSGQPSCRGRRVRSPGPRTASVRSPYTSHRSWPGTLAHRPLVVRDRRSAGVGRSRVRLPVFARYESRLNLVADRDLVDVPGTRCDYLGNYDNAARSSG